MEPNSNDLEGKMDLMNRQLARISFHLFNDLEAGKDGLINKADKNEIRIEKLETDAKIRNARNAIWGSIGGGIVILARELFAVLKHA